MTAFSWMIVAFAMLMAGVCLFTYVQIGRNAHQSGQCVFEHGFAGPGLIQLTAHGFDRLALAQYIGGLGLTVLERISGQIEHIAIGLNLTFEQRDARAQFL